MGGDFGKQLDTNYAHATLPNFHEAAKWYSKAADLGDVDSQYTLCRWYSGDHGETSIQYPNGRKETAAPVVDYSVAFGWCSKAARSGDDKAQLKVAQMLQRGREVLQDYKEALHWYIAAAEQGNINAMVELANIYDVGKVTTQNSKEATKWYQRAANLGNIEAQFGMGQRYYFGVGVTKSTVLAHMWLDLAASHSAPGAGLNQENGRLHDEDTRQAIQLATNLRYKVEQFMTPNEIREAQRLAHEWKPK
jgi:hypothetical protein